MTLLRWLDDWTIINELLVLLPPLAVYWALSERQFRRPDADRPD
jgi:hypothetical protein